MIDVAQRLGLWIPQVVGRYINEDWNPTNHGFGAQCWDAAANWSKYLGLPVINTGGKGRWPGWAGNMVDAFPQSAAIAAAYELIGPDEPGLPGDIPVWGDGYYYYPKTHVAVLVRDLGAQLLCISQNSSASLAGNPYPEWTTGPTTLQHLPRRGLIGLIRPRTGGLAAQGTITTTSEEDDVSAQEVLSWPIERTDGQTSTVAVELAKIGPDNQALQASIRELNETLKALPAKVAEATMTHPVTLTTGQDSNLLTELAALRPDLWQVLRAIGNVQLTGNVTVDAAAIAKAVNDEAAERMAN